MSGKIFKPSDDELNKVMEYEMGKNKLEESKSILCQPLQDYVDIAGILYDFVLSDDLRVYQTKSGYCVCFKK